MFWSSLIFSFFFFFFNDPATPEIYTLSLHDALPIFRRDRAQVVEPVSDPRRIEGRGVRSRGVCSDRRPGAAAGRTALERDGGDARAAQVARRCGEHHGLSEVGTGIGLAGRRRGSVGLDLVRRGRRRPVAGVVADAVAVLRAATRRDAVGARGGSEGTVARAAVVRECSRLALERAGRGVYVSVRAVVSRDRERAGDVTVRVGDRDSA